MWVIFGISFWIVIANMSGSSSQSSSTANTVVAPIKVTSAQIVSDYKENGVAADAKYKDKLIEVSGTVKTIDKDITDTPYISLESYEYAIVDHVQCMFDRNKATELASVKKGQKIVLQGSVQGKLGNIIVNKCQIVK